MTSQTCKAVHTAEVGLDAIDIPKSGRNAKKMAQVAMLKSGCNIIFAALAEVDPVAKVAVAAFGTAIGFFFKYQENEFKTFALVEAMKNMMDVLRYLVGLDDDGRGILPQNLDDRMKRIADDISSCVNFCRGYRNQHRLKRMVWCPYHEANFKEWNDKFETHRKGLNGCLDALILVKTQTLHQKFDDFVSQLRVWETEKECKLRELIEKKKGTNQEKFDEFCDDDQLMAELIVIDTEGERNDLDSRSGDVLDIQRMVLELRRETRKEFEETLERTKEIFISNFGKQQKDIHQLQDLTTKIYDTVSGHYDLLQSDDLKYFWKEMNGKHSVKARHLVMTLRDHYFESNIPRPTKRRIGTFSEVSHEEFEQEEETVKDEKSNETGAELQLHPPIMNIRDRWTLKYITLHRVQPLVEDLDPDASGFVTIVEANTFLSAPPEEWSFLHRLAYSTTGFEMTLRYYYVRIVGVLRDIERLFESLPLYNTAPISAFLHDYPSSLFVDRILAGLYESLFNDAYNDQDWNEELWASRFKEHVIQQEEEMDMMLKKLRYDVDGQPLLDSIIGGLRLERVRTNAIRLPPPSSRAGHY
ncbi:hypothetical protein VKT23_000034 [Stygiomarasmius scandens]|uniref:Fungal STAND N-terminal Goodbye domain-containing protein n=1 Tax=Marasmiellus scandens TaxID=2682957 RepID=A0ABR1K3D0_9AGAR